MIDLLEKTLHKKGRCTQVNCALNILTFSTCAFLFAFCRPMRRMFFDEGWAFSVWRTQRQPNKFDPTGFRNKISCVSHCCDNFGQRQQFRIRTHTTYFGHAKRHVVTPADNANNARIRLLNIHHHTHHGMLELNAILLFRGGMVVQPRHTIHIMHGFTLSPPLPTFLIGALPTAKT